MEAQHDDAPSCGHLHAQGGDSTWSQLVGDTERMTALSDIWAALAGCRLVHSRACARAEIRRMWAVCVSRGPWLAVLRMCISLRAVKLSSPLVGSSSSKIAGFVTSSMPIVTRRLQHEHPGWRCKPAC